MDDKYIIGDIFSSGGATLYKNPSDQTVTRDLEIFKTSQANFATCTIIPVYLTE